MRYRLVCVGRRAQDPLLESADDYLKRLGRYVPAELIRVKEGSIDAERGELLKQLGKHDRVVILDERGELPTTVELADRLRRFDRDGLSTLSFVIGGADGLHPEVKARGHWQMALSKLTLPHRLAQVVLLEQLYRAHTLLRGEPYHRA